MQANVVIVGATRGFETLTYSIPPALDGRIQPGHRVLAPLRSRKLTGVVTEVGEQLSTGQLKPILEVLEPRPLFDRAHLQLMEFLASYYMVSIADAYRIVIPAVARVESRTAYRLATPPDELARAAFTRVERAIIETIAKRAATARSLEKIGPPGEVRATIARFIADGTLERRDAATGRHRDTADLIARLATGASIEAVRGSKQREVLNAIANAGATGARVADLKAEIDGASAALKSLARRGLIAIEAAPSAATHGVAAAQFDLTDEQQVALDAISPAIEHRRYEAFLLWGVTASGKTEIYLKLAARALAAGRNVLILVPEIALADEIVRSFRARFGSLVAVAHSAQSVSERWASWMAAIGGQARVMIGPRSAIFAPIHDAGLIVVDEEHDASYKNEEGIYYHARDLAVALAGFSKCPVVLGSATPSSESYANSRRGRYRLIRLSRRVNDRAMASVEVVDMRREVADARMLAAARARKWSATGTAEAASGGSSGCGAALDGASCGAARKSRVGRPEHGVSQPPRVSQFSAMPYLRQRDRVPELQRQHDVPYARPLAPMPLLRQSYCGARHLPRMPWLRAQGPGLRHRETHAGVGGDDAGGEDRKNGLRHQQSARSACADAGRASRG